MHAYSAARRTFAEACVRLAAVCNLDAMGASATCRKVLEQMIADRAKDFRLDTHLREACTEDIGMTCAFQQEATHFTSNDDGKVIHCLQDLRHELRDNECRAAVERTIERTSDDYRFAAFLASRCRDDREKLCKNVAPVRLLMPGTTTRHFRSTLQHHCAACTPRLVRHVGLGM